jgi:predicted MPP superfamily phosphohydrolase
LTPVGLAILLVAWVGHAFALTVALNVVYSFPLHRRLLRGFRLLIGIAVFAFAFAFPWLIHRIVDGPWRFEPVTVWLTICLVVALVVLPIQTLRRRLRAKPRAEVHRSGDVVDFGAAGRRSLLGFGKHWRLARLPGNLLLEVEFTDLTLRLPRLPAALDGLTIVHLSDLHFHGTPSRAFFKAVLDQVAAWGVPDLVCLTGDFVDTVRHQYWVKPLLGRLRYREAGFAVLGNHDLYCRPNDIRRQLRRAGYVVLGNSWRELRIRGESVVVIGNETPWYSPAADMAEAPAGRFRLLLSHTPDTIAWARANSVDLMLAGHVHGGQVRLPVVGSLFVPSRYSRKYDGGVFEESPTVMHVSRGLSGREPLRIGCRPEVSRLTLRSWPTAE